MPHSVRAESINNNGIFIKRMEGKEEENCFRMRCRTKWRPGEQLKGAAKRIETNSLPVTSFTPAPCDDTLSVRFVIDTVSHDWTSALEKSITECNFLEKRTLPFRIFWWGSLAIWIDVSFICVRIYSNYASSLWVLQRKTKRWLRFPVGHLSISDPKRLKLVKGCWLV